MPHGLRRISASCRTLLFLLCAAASPVVFGLPTIDRAALAEVPGRWDLIPVDMPDRTPEDVKMSSDGLVWILSNGGVASYDPSAHARNAHQLKRVKSSAELPAIIGHSLAALPDGQMYVSTIWREGFIATRNELERVSDRGIRGSYALVMLPGGRAVISIDDPRPGDDDLRALTIALGRSPLHLSGYESLVALENRLFAFDGQQIHELDTENGRSLWAVKVEQNAQGALSALHVAGNNFYAAFQKWYGPGGCYVGKLDGDHHVDQIYAGPCFDLFRP